MSRTSCSRTSRSATAIALILFGVLTIAGVGSSLASIPDESGSASALADPVAESAHSTEIRASVAEGKTPSADDEDEWTILLRSDRLSPQTQGPVPLPAADPRVSIDRVDVKEHQGVVWLAFHTYANDTVPEISEGRYESTLNFQVERAKSGAQAGIEIHVGAAGEVDVNVYGANWTRQPLYYQGETAPWGYIIGISKLITGEDDPIRAGDRIHSAWATIEASYTTGPGASDRVPEQGTGGSHTLKSSPPPQAAWAHGQGPDFAAGPDLATGPDDTIHIAYVVSSGERESEQGLYHGTLDMVEDPWNATHELILDTQRVGGFTNRDRDRQHDTLQVALSVDAQGMPHILYHPDPHGPQGQIRYLTKTGNGWISEDPADVAGDNALRVFNGWDSIPWIVTDAGRIVAGLPTTNGFAVVERTGTDRWELVHEVADGRFPRLDVASDGTLHLAWFQPHSAQGQGSQDGDLHYTSESRDWDTVEIAQGIHERTHGWESAGNDGGFSFALGPQDVPHFIWEVSGPRGWNQHYGILDGELSTEPAPFDSSGGHILRMRILFDANGTAHMATGRGSLEFYSTRDRQGSWMTQRTESIDIFNLAVRSTGEAFYVGTQRHGGASLHLAGTTKNPTSPHQPDVSPEEGEVGLLPPAPFMLGLAAVAGALLVGTAGARRFADAHPRVVWTPLAFVGGFSRLNKKKVMDHVTRDAILEAVSSDPGRSAAGVRASLDIPRSTFYYHLRRLEQEDMLKIRRKGRDLLLFDTGAPPGRTPLSESDRELLLTLKEKPGRTASEYARMVAAQERTIRNRLRRLEELRVVERYVTNPREIRWSTLQDTEIGEAS